MVLKAKNIVQKIKMFSILFEPSYPLGRTLNMFWGLFGLKYFHFSAYTQIRFFGALNGHFGPFFAQQNCRCPIDATVGLCTGILDLDTFALWPHSPNMQRPVMMATLPSKRLRPRSPIVVVVFVPSEFSSTLIALIFNLINLI